VTGNLSAKDRFPLCTGIVQDRVLCAIEWRRQIPVAAQSKAWVYGRSLAGIVFSSPAGRMDVCLL
jgi:hypothetical protein